VHGPTSLMVMTQRTASSTSVILARVYKLWTPSGSVHIEETRNKAHEVSESIEDDRDEAPYGSDGWAHIHLFLPSTRAHARRYTIGTSDPFRCIYFLQHTAL
jgi:hypothetical protein